MTFSRTTSLLALALTGAVGSQAGAALVVDLSAGSGTDTTVDGAVVNTWSDGATTFTRSGSDARYVADSGGGIAAIDFDRSAPFAGDITAANGAATIGDATVLVWANFDGYSDHTTGASSYYFSINGSGNEHTLGRDGNGGTDYIYHWDGVGQSTGTLQPQPAGWNLYIARYYGASLSGAISAEAWIDAVGDGAVVTGAADLINADSTAYNGDADSVLIGTWTNAGSGLDGQIRALQIYNTILTDAEVQAAARGITGVPEPGSLALLGMGGLVLLRRRRG